MCCTPARVPATQELSVCRKFAASPQRNKIAVCASKSYGWKGRVKHWSGPGKELILLVYNLAFWLLPAEWLLKKHRLKLYYIRHIISVCTDFCGIYCCQMPCREIKSTKLQCMKDPPAPHLPAQQNLVAQMHIVTSSHKNFPPKTPIFMHIKGINKSFEGFP